MKHDGTLSASTPKIIINQLLICSSILQKPRRVLPQKAEHEFYVLREGWQLIRGQGHRSAEALPPPGGTRQPFSSGPSRGCRATARFSQLRLPTPRQGRRDLVPSDWYRPLRRTP